jgi:hypothetical protein
VSNLSAWAAEHQVKFLKHLRGRLETVVEGDDALEVIRDTIEGEVDIDAIFNALLGSRAETLARAEGLKTYIAELQGSVDAAERYAERVKTLIYEALVSAGQDGWKGLKGSVSITPGGKSVEVINEALVPHKYWKRPDPVLDKQAIRPLALEAEKQREEIAGDASLTDEERKKKLAAVVGIPGVTVKTGEPTLTIRKPSGARKAKAEKKEPASVH